MSPPSAFSSISTQSANGRAGRARPARCRRSLRAESHRWQARGQFLHVVAERSHAGHDLRPAAAAEARGDALPRRGVGPIPLGLDDHRRCPSIGRARGAAKTATRRRRPAPPPPALAATPTPIACERSAAPCSESGTGGHRETPPTAAAAAPVSAGDQRTRVSPSPSSPSTPATPIVRTRRRSAPQAVPDLAVARRMAERGVVGDEESAGDEPLPDHDAAEHEKPRSRRSDRRRSALTGATSASPTPLAPPRPPRGSERREVIGHAS